jgi:hypothetical protein
LHPRARHPCSSGHDQLVFLDDVGFQLDGLGAGSADQAHQALSEDDGERVGDDPRLDAEIDETHDGLHRVGGVEGGHHQVAGERRLQGDACRLGVANLADEDDVGVLAQHGPQPGREGEPHAHVGLALGDGGELHFDGVLQRNDVDAGGIEQLQERVERRRLAGAGRSAGHEKTLILQNELAHARLHRRVHPQPIEGDRTLPEQMRITTLPCEQEGRVRRWMREPRWGSRENCRPGECAARDVHAGELLMRDHVPADVAGDACWSSIHRCGNARRGFAVKP